jgi:hypothetical protein
VVPLHTVRDSIIMPCDCSLATSTAAFNQVLHLTFCSWQVLQATGHPQHQVLLHNAITTAAAAAAAVIAT